MLTKAALLCLASPDGNRTWIASLYKGAQVQLESAMVGENCLLEMAGSKRHANYILECIFPGTSYFCFKNPIIWTAGLTTGYLWLSKKNPDTPTKPTEADRAQFKKGQPKTMYAFLHSPLG